MLDHPALSDSPRWMWKFGSPVEKSGMNYDTRAKAMHINDMHVGAMRLFTTNHDPKLHKRK